jgi:hypothetical protein
VAELGKRELPELLVPQVRPGCRGFRECRVLPERLERREQKERLARQGRRDYRVCLDRRQRSEQLERPEL